MKSYVKTWLLLCLVRVVFKDMPSIQCRLISVYYVLCYWENDQFCNLVPPGSVQYDLIQNLLDKMAICQKPFDSPDSLVSVPGHGQPEMGPNGLQGYWIRLQTRVEVGKQSPGTSQIRKWGDCEMSKVYEQPDLKKQKSGVYKQVQSENQEVRKKEELLVTQSEIKKSPVAQAFPAPLRRLM